MLAQNEEMKKVVWWVAFLINEK